MNAIEVRGLTKEYSNFKLDNVSFNLPQGCILGLIGENGAGKSTIIKLIMDAIRRDSGEITVLGKDNKNNFQATKEDIGVALDDAYFPEAFTVKNVNTIMKNTYSNWEEERFFQYINRFSLPLQKPFKEFSRGMKMKLAIAVSLSHKAKLLILDEATSGLDPIVRDEIVDLFHEFTRDECNSILLSSHIVSDLEKLCDYIAFIHNGKLVFYEEKDRLLEKYGILRCSKEDLEIINPSAIVSKRSSGYGIEALVVREEIPTQFSVDYSGVEDIMLFMIKGEK